MASKLLQNQFKKIQSEPIEGVCFELVNENLFEWKAYVEGPPETDYEGGIFQISMKFPTDYPMNPPTLVFLSEFWHPNVYPDGKVCISILHPPGEDETSGELPEERWLPTQTVTTIILSVISLLSAPNTSSPANVDASVEWRNERDAYKKRIKALIAKASQKVPPHIKIPHPDSDPLERAKQVEKMKLLNKPMDFFDDYDDAGYDEDDDDDVDYDYDDDEENYSDNDDDEGIDNDDD